MTTFGDQVKQFGGVPVSGPFILQTGKAFFVKPVSGNDGNTGLSLTAPLKTLRQALTNAVANRGDIVYLVAEGNASAATTDYQTTTLTWNKDGVHLIGINAGPLIGQRSRIAQDSTVKTLDNLFVLSANGCLIANIGVFQGVATSTATSPVAMTITGDRNHIVNCQFSGIGDTSMDVAGARSLVVAIGSENTIENCYIGLDTVLRATAAAEVEMTGAVTRNIFRNCIFSTYTSSANFLTIKVPATLDRFLLLDDCIFMASRNITSAVAPNAVLGGSLSSVNGVILLRNPLVTGIANVTAADEARVQVLGLNGLATGHLIGITQGVDVT
jgi:hypothetical protein